MFHRTRRRRQKLIYIIFNFYQKFLCYWHLIILFYLFTNFILIKGIKNKKSLNKANNYQNNYENDEFFRMFF